MIKMFVMLDHSFENKYFSFYKLLSFAICYTTGGEDKSGKIIFDL